MPGPQPCHYRPFIFCPVGRGLDPSAASRQTPANGSHVGEGFIPPAYLPPPPTSAAACGQAALRAPFVVRSVGRSLAPLRGVGDAAPYSGNPQVFLPPPTLPGGLGAGRPTSITNPATQTKSQGEHFVRPGGLTSSES